MSAHANVYPVTVNVTQIQTVADVNSLTTAAASPTSGGASAGADQLWDGVLRRQTNVSAYTPSTIGKKSALPAGKSCGVRSTVPGIACGCVCKRTSGLARGRGEIISLLEK